MSKKSSTPPSEIDTKLGTEADTTPSDDVFADELYDARLTKTVKHRGEWHYPGTVFEGIDIDFASALQASEAAEITPSQIA